MERPDTVRVQARRQALERIGKLASGVGIRPVQAQTPRGCCASDLEPYNPCNVLCTGTVARPSSAES